MVESEGKRSIHAPPRPVAPSTTGSCRTISETPMFWLKGPSRSAAFSAPRAPPSLACVYSRRPPMGDLDELLGRPSGVSQGGPREGPQSAILLYTGVTLEVILVSLFGANLHTVLQKAPKWGVQKVVKTGPLGRVLGELGCLLFLLKVLGDQPLIKRTITQAPQAPAQEGSF